MSSYHPATEILIRRLVDLKEHATLRAWDTARATLDAIKDNPEVSKSALDIQIGGDHYKTLATQPIEYILANKLPFSEGCVVKYITRWRAKGGVKDLEKAKHFIELLIEEENKSVK